MPKFMMLEIDNSRESSVSGKWSDPGAALYDQLLNAMWAPDDKADSPDSKHTGDYLKETYLVAPLNQIKNSPHGKTPYSRSGCKYPHHVIRDNKLVVHEAGVKAAYARAKQQGIFKGEFKEHLERHYRELGIYEGSTMKTDEKIQENFKFIENYLIEELGELRRGVNMEDELDWLENFFNEADDDSISVTDAIMKNTGMSGRVETKKAHRKAIEDAGDPPELGEEEEDLNTPTEESDDEEPKKKPKSRAQEVEQAYTNKNGVRRKALYIAFIEYAKSIHSKNTFGSVFDKDAFKVTYPFVPQELRFFYRLANPLLCVLENNLTFFALSELKKINAGNNFTKFIVFAATETELYLFYMVDGKVYKTSETVTSLASKTDLKPSMELIGESFDKYLENMVGQQILDVPLQV